MRLIVFGVLSATLALGVAAAELASTNGATAFGFLEPRPVAYVLEQTNATLAAASRSQSWLRAHPADGSTNLVELGSRVVLQLNTNATLAGVLDNSPLKPSRQLAENLWILQAPGAMSAVQEAARIAQLPGVLICYPVTRRQVPRQGAYARLSNDPYFDQQWNLENRDPATGARTGVDLNVRSAWAITTGKGITVAQGDDGVEMTHPDLARALEGSPHFNFETQEVNGQHGASFQDHGTSVAGLIAAEGNNRRGGAGLAPDAKLASWVIWTRGDLLVDDEQLMEMFQYQSNVVAVQNHSWANASDPQFSAGVLVTTGISNAVIRGRGGLGEVLTRSAGNGREDLHNANDDGFNNTPLSISVAAVRSDGRVASYSNPGACLLVAAPSSDTDFGFPTVFSTDRLGTLGENRGSYTNDLADYAFGATGFTGTSASAPQIAGIAALILSANPALGYRDVQQILMHSARQFDLADPGMQTNSAGFRVSHNTGFGVPDAGQAVRLALRWTNRPPLTNVTARTDTYTTIPDDGLRLVVKDPVSNTELASIGASPSLGIQAETATALFPLVDVGLATNNITVDLHGKAALIQRGGVAASEESFFKNKINRAAEAGAAMAVIYNNAGGNQRITMLETDFAPIPAVFIDQNDGEALRGLLAATNNLAAQIAPQSVAFSFEITPTLLCEHVMLTVDTDHQRRGDLRIVLISPQGTRSVMQRANADTSAGPVNWTYMSTLNFYECSAGTWKAYVTDEGAGRVGGVRSMSLNITGTAIKDTDHDGLDDDWEMKYFGSLSATAQDDPDGDGYNNAREQVMGTNPTVSEFPLVVDISPLNNRLARLSWPAVSGQAYDVLTAGKPLGLSALTNFVGRFPETEWVLPTTNLPGQFFQIRATTASGH